MSSILLGAFFNNTAGFILSENSFAPTELRFFSCIIFTKVMLLWSRFYPDFEIINKSETKHSYLKIKKTKLFSAIFKILFINQLSDDFHSIQFK